MQVKFSPYHQTGDFGVRSKSIKFQLQIQFQRFLCQTLCVFSQIKDRKHIDQKFHSVAWILPQGWDMGAGLGGAGVKNFKMRICDSAPLTARSCLKTLIDYTSKIS